MGKGSIGWPTHREKQRRKASRLRWLKREGLLTYRDAEDDRRLGITRDKGI